MKNLNELTESEIILKIFKCDQDILHILKFNGTQGIEVYPGTIMGLGDFYCEKHLLLTKLLKRRNHDSK